jgi:hypothetical protein
MDNPKVPLFVLDKDNNIATIKGNKVYVINIIMQFQYEEKIDYKIFKVVCNRSGILKIEETNS